MGTLLLSLYAALLVVLSAHGAHRLVLLWGWWRTRGTAPVQPPLPTELPLVTVQLPVYNERDVVVRLVDAVRCLDWPVERLQLQLLDDSSDDTGTVSAAAVARARAAGIDASTVRRADRAGFKAGALANGLLSATGEFIAVFDADFVPNPDFLRRTIPHFVDPLVGMVQCRWGHINEGDSALTQAQATLLDGHFVIEQAARNRTGVWFNFNGTAGVWRRTSVASAGGWEHDTLTEDLDLSYRAQMAGWRFVYLVDEVVPAELPDSLAAFRAQQRRWAIGSVQTARKLAGRIGRSSAPLASRAEALAHLSANLVWPLVVALSVLLPAVVWTRGSASSGHLWFDLPAFGFSIGINALFYTLAGRGRWWRVPGVLALGSGMAVGQAVATLTALVGRSTPFVRTPKNGGGNGSYRLGDHGFAPIEAALAIVHFVTIGVCVMRGWWGSIPFLLLFGAGYGWVASMGFRERLAGVRTVPTRPESPYSPAIDDSYPLPGK